MAGRMLALAAVAAALLAAGPVAAQEGMPSFESDEALLAFLIPDPDSGLAVATPPPPAPPPPAAAPPGVAFAAPSPPPPPASPAPGNPSITNVQIAGVDEGGIVKVIGEHLVVLRRGRLFTVSTAGGELRAVDAIDAYPPGVEARGDWYDEMLVSGDLIVVIGYSYGRGGTEINRFRMSPDGRLSFVDAHHLKSDDYYSSRNYASRLIGDQLVVYSPLRFQSWHDDPLEALPGLSRWRDGQNEPEWRRIASARQVYMPRPLRKAGPGAVEALHTVSRCDLTAPELRCEATVVLGPSGRTFFVSQNAVYVWVRAAWRRAGADRAFLYRIPLDGGRPSAVQVEGGPPDQFAFHPNAAAGRLDVLVTDISGGDGMWAPEFAQGQPALLRLPMSRFGDGSQAAPPSDYTPLPGGRGSLVAHDRFVGDWLLYALRARQGAARDQLVAVPVDRGAPVIFELADTVERIEQIGADGLVVGGREAVVFTTIDLSSGQRPMLGDRFEQPGSRNAESRSHAFFFRPDSPDGADGLAGLPTLTRDGAQMLFVRRLARRLSGFGALTAGGADANPRVNDGCKASCVDWYGDARPIFLGGRVFALMGYELVEGDASGEAIREIRRLDFTPVPPGAGDKTPQPDDAPAPGK